MNSQTLGRYGGIPSLAGITFLGIGGHDFPLDRRAFHLLPGSCSLPSGKSFPARPETLSGAKSLGCRWQGAVRKFFSRLSHLINS